MVVLSRFRALAERTKTDMDDFTIDIFRGIKPPFYLLVSLYAAVWFLTLSDFASGAFKFFFIVVIVYEVIRACQKLSYYFLKKYIQKNGDSTHEGVLHVGRVVISFGLWSVGLLLVLSNFGIDVTSLIASLGIGGIAIALAVQNVLGDIFSSFSIYIDKPFEAGDFIVIGEDSGTVEKIGLKTTRIRTLRGEELVVSNKELTTVRVQNLKKMQRRRESFMLQVAYETPNKKLEKIPKMIEDIISPMKDIAFDRCHLVKLGDFALEYEVVYFLDSPDYNIYMDRKQAINLGIKEAFGKEGIAFPYPKQHIILEKVKKGR
jgi:small-conductance mechanosensitive channel